MIKALIFDVDGTLAETEEAHRQAFNDTFRAEGLNWVWDRDEYRRLLKVAGGKERLRHFRDLQGLNLPSEGELQTMHARKTTRYKTLVAKGDVKLRPGVHDLIEQARSAGLRLAIATTTSRENVDALCMASWGQPAEYVFGVIASGEEVAYKKPDPAIYHLALDRLGVSPGEAVAIEDSTIGLASARAARLPTLVTPSTYTRGDDFSNATWRAATLEDWTVEFLAFIAA